MGGGIRGSATLKPGGTYDQEIVINQWCGFEKPGKYRVTCISHIVEFQHAPPNATKYKSETVALKSPPVEIELVTEDDAKRLERIAKATDRLKNGSQSQIEA